MAISFCPGVDQLADGLTKVLASKRMDMLMKAWGMTVSELRKGVEPPGQVRRLHASAEPQQQQDITTAAHQPPTGNLSCCLGLLVLLQGLTSVRADENPEAPTPLAMDSSLELYGLMLMLVICIITLWEAGRVCVRTQGTAARLRSCQAEPKLSKKDLRRLNGLLQMDPGELSPAEKETLINLAEAAGVNLGRILHVEASRSSSSSRRGSTPPPPTPPRRTYEDLVEEDDRRRRSLGEAQPVPPPPPPPTCAAVDEEFLRRRRTQEDRRFGLQLASEPTMGVGDTPREDRRARTREVGVQVELLREMPRCVYMTPSGGCVHSTRDCSTLNKSVKYTQRDVCQRCIPGQREHTDRPLG